MELAIAIFLGAFLSMIGAIGYWRLSRDFKEGKEEIEK